MTQAESKIPLHGSPPDLRDVVNVACVPQRSPFRYPGGKTWLIPQVRRWIASAGSTPTYFVEPFAGGAIAGLTVAFEDLAERVILVELDKNVGAVWRAILNGKAGRLIDRILSFDLTIENVREVLSSRSRKLEDIAFATLVRNRVQHGGIMAGGASFMKRGENGRGLASRWYPETLARRIAAIAPLGRRIEFRCADGFDSIQEFADEEMAVFFVDPPYTVTGRRLYEHSDVDHQSLFRLMSGVRGDFLMTYDDTEEVRGWAEEFRLECETVRMKTRQNRTKSELLIGRGLSWARV